MKNIESIVKFKDQGTYRLLGLGIITYGVYFAHYIKRQTVRINGKIDKQERISTRFVNAIIAMSYISLFLFFAYFIVDDGHPVERAGTLFDRVCGIMILVWGFKARNRFNSIYEISTENEEWFNGLWTFLFTPLYINYKINRICEQCVESIAAPDAALPRRVNRGVRHK